MNERGNLTTEYFTTTTTGISATTESKRLSLLEFEFNNLAKTQSHFCLIMTFSSSPACSHGGHRTNRKQTMPHVWTWTRYNKRLSKIWGHALPHPYDVGPFLVAMW